MPVKYYNARVQYYNARGQVLKCSRCIMGVAAVGWLEVTEEGVCTVHGGVVHDPSGWLRCTVCSSGAQVATAWIGKGRRRRGPKEEVDGGRRRRGSTEVVDGGGRCSTEVVDGEMGDSARAELASGQPNPVGKKRG